jgi:ribosomal protein S7
VDLPDDAYGNTTKRAADFAFSACKVGANWRFQLSSLSTAIGSRVRDVTFLKNVVSASDAVVTKDSFARIVSDLRPNLKVNSSVPCGGKSYPDKTTTKSRRKEFWNHQLVIDHEAFHRKDWMDMYRPELVKAEQNVWAHSIPLSEATDATGAVAKASKDLSKYVIDAFQSACAAYAPQQEARAYDAGAPAYQKLVDEIEARAKKEGWI